MRTPREKYQNDPTYATLVNILVSYIDTCQFTPSELREASILASIIHEENKSYHTTFIKKDDTEVIESLNKIDKWLDTKSIKNKKEN